jgi:SAM-dependent methyltransferase
MNEPTPRFWGIFFEVYENLPRQGPGNRDSAVKALGLCRELPEHPEILDLGCGVGGQTFYLAAELSSARIMAIDSHSPSIERLQAAVNARGLAHRVHAIVGDMARPGLPHERFDLIWSEGALYSIGLQNALGVCYGLLRPGGYIAFTDAVWCRDNPPPAVKAGFDLDYPTMGTVTGDIRTIQDCGFELVSHFTLPDEAWWDDFYSPWRPVSWSCVGNMQAMLKRPPYSTNLRRNRRCTGAIPTFMPMSFSLPAVPLHARAHGIPT